MRRVVLPLVALLLAGVSTYAVRSWLEGQRRPAPVAAQTVPEQRKAVLVAAQNLAVGTFVQTESLRWQEWPDIGTPETYLVRGASDQADLVGAVVRRPLTIGQPITADSVVKPGARGFLAAVLEPGMRAISVPIDEASGNAGLILPGDHVDVILTQTIEIAGDPAGSRRVSETVLQDARVIAMGRRLTTEGADEGAAGQQARTATLEVDAGGRREGGPGHRARQARLEPAQSRRRGRAAAVGGPTHMGHRRQPGSAAREPAPLQPGGRARRQARYDRHPPGSRTMKSSLGRHRPGARLQRAAILLGLAALLALGQFTPAEAETTIPTSGQLVLEVHKGQLIRLERPAAAVFVADPEVADVQAHSPTLVYVFGRRSGSTTLFAVDDNEDVLLRREVVVEHNLSGLQGA